MRTIKTQIIFAEDNPARHVQLKHFYNSLVEEFPTKMSPKIQLEDKYVKSSENFFNQIEQQLISTLCVFLDLNLLSLNSAEAAKKLQGEFLLEVLSKRIPVIAYSSVSPAEFDTLWEVNQNGFFWLDSNVLFENSQEHAGLRKINIRNVINYIFSNHPIFKYEYGEHKTLKIDKIFKSIGVNSSNNFLNLPDQVNVQVNTEYSPLKKVIIHSPGAEVDVPPLECDKYLIDQPVDANLFRSQHEKFKNSLRQEIGEKNNDDVLEASDLLKTVLEKDDILYDFIDDLVNLHNLDRKYIMELFFLFKETPDHFIKMVIDGYLDKNKKVRFIPPVPNFMFTRDWAFSIGQHIFVSKMNKPARKREGLISSYILKYNFPNHYVDNDMLELDEEDSIEGGDVLLLPQNIVLVGISDRTNLEAIRKVAKFLGTTSQKESSRHFRIYATAAPFRHKRSMHLDTFMGVFSQNGCVAYHNPLQNRNVFYKLGKDGEVEDIFFETLETMMMKEFKLNMKIVWAYDEMEQFNDGCNIFTIAPFKYFSYDMTKKTIGSVKMEFRNAGVTIIPVEGSELALARGGTHCMTLPILREE